MAHLKQVVFFILTIAILVVSDLQLFLIRSLRLFHSFYLIWSRTTPKMPRIRVSRLVRWRLCTRILHKYPLSSNAGV